MLAPPAGKTGVLAVILGASTFPRSRTLGGSPAFGQSARAWRDYLSESMGLGTESILELFDSPLDPTDQLKQLIDFLKPRRATATDLLVYYVGHGGFLKNRSYYLAVNATGDEDTFISSLLVETLATAITTYFRSRRVYLILDCCFAAEAARVLFQSEALELMQQRVQEFFPSAGTALLAAASKNDVAITPKGAQYTAFSHQLLEVLRKGIPGAAQQVSLWEVGEHVRELLVREASDAPLPQVHSPDQKGGDVARYPLFPNPIGHPIPPNVRLNRPRVPPRRWWFMGGAVGLALGVAALVVIQKPWEHEALKPSEPSPPAWPSPEMDRRNPWLPLPDGKVEMQTYEVSRAEYAAYMAATGHGDDEPPWGGPREPLPHQEALPATSVTRDQATAYCKSLGGWLPTLAEWESEALRVPPLPANFNSCKEPLPVGTSAEPASPSGFHDLLSNAWEYLGGVDRSGHRVLGGLPCMYKPIDIRSSVKLREWNAEQTTTSDFNGFRCARARR